LKRTGKMPPPLVDRLNYANWTTHPNNPMAYTARVINSGHFRGQPFSADEWVTDVIVRSDAGWKCVLSHVTPASKQDGAGAE
jgi:hypothetical protein